MRNYFKDVFQLLKIIGSPFLEAVLNVLIPNGDRLVTRRVRKCSNTYSSTVNYTNPVGVKLSTLH